MNEETRDANEHRYQLDIANRLDQIVRQLKLINLKLDPEDKALDICVTALRKVVKDGDRMGADAHGSQIANIAADALHTIGRFKDD